MRRLLSLVLIVLALVAPAYAQGTTASLTSTTCPGSGCVALVLTGGGQGSAHVSGTWVGTLVFETATLPCDTYAATPVLPVSGMPVAVSSTTTNGAWFFGASASECIRVRFSVYTSGAAQVTLFLGPTGTSSTGGLTAAELDARLPLPTTATMDPTGLATDTGQATGNASLTSIDGKLPALSAGRIPVVLPAGGSGLTDLELRASPVPVSGPLTDAQLRATEVTVLNPQITASGTLSTAGTNVAIDTRRAVGVRAAITALTATGGSFTLQVSPDNATWFVAPGVGGLDVSLLTPPASFSWRFNGYPYAKLITVGGLTGGTMSVVLTAPQSIPPPETQDVSGAVTATVTPDFFAVFPVSGPLTNTELRATPVPVSGTFFQATQPVSGTVAVSNFPATQAVTGTFWPATQPVSGTVTANAGTGTLTVGQATGTNLHVVVDTAPTTAVTGTFFQATQPVSIASMPSTPVTGTFWQATQPVSGTFWQATQPVSLATLPALATGTNVIGALTANQSVNHAQVNGVTTSTGVGIADTGTQRVALTQEATYAASTVAKTATAAGTAAFAELCGSATKTVRLQRVMISGTVATAAIYGDLQIRKNSSAATGGTATTLTATPYDSGSAAATATAKYFTVLPTGGAVLVGNLMSETAYFPITATVAMMQPQLVYAWRDTDAEAPTLRGTAQCITAGFGTTPTNVPTLSVSIAWTEK